MAARSLAIASLVLGLVSLPTAGGMGIGALAGLLAGIVAFTRLRRAQTREGQKIAVAGIVLNLAAAVVAVPLAGMLLVLYEEGAPTRAGEGGRAPPEEGAPSPPGPDVVADATPRPSGTAEPEASGEPAPVRSDPDLREPRKLHHVDPVYPEEARRSRVQGTVVLECVIGTDGRVRSARVVRGVPALDEAAVEAAKQWRYEPTELRGRRVPVVMTVTINFRLR